MTIGAIEDPSGGDTTVALVNELRIMNEKLDGIERATTSLHQRVESIEELREDLWPMVRGASGALMLKLVELEKAGALGFLTEGARMAEVVATSFDEEDVRLLGENVVTILRTVRNFTQPELLGLADRAATALKESETRPEKKIGLFRALRDPEVRRGMTVMLGVMRELGADPANGKGAGLVATTEAQPTREEGADS